MALGVTNITAAKPGTSGPVFIAPLGTTLPSDATTALAGTYKSLGSVSEDGVTYTQEVDSEDIKRYGGDVVLTLQKGRTWTAQFTLIDALSVDVKKVVFGDSNVSGALGTGITAYGTSAELTGHVWVFEHILRDGAVERTVFPNGVVTAVGDTNYTDGGLVSYEITVTGMPDSNGKSKYEYTKRASGSSS